MYISMYCIPDKHSQTVPPARLGGRRGNLSGAIAASVKPFGKVPPSLLWKATHSPGAPLPTGSTWKPFRSAGEWDT